MYQHEQGHYLEYRAMQASDLRDVLAIENAVYEFPWTEQIFRDCLHSDYQCTVVELYHSVIGYLIVSRVLDEAHLMNICLAQEWQHHGFGKTILSRLVNDLKNSGIHSVFLEVRPSNRIALALYSSLGFEIIGTRKDYYPAIHGREDAISMVLTMAAGPVK